MKLPNFQNAVIDEAKLRDYCLNPQHPRGKHKARMFRSALGLTVKDTATLRQMILDGIAVFEAEIGEADEYGQRFTVDIDVVTQRRVVRIRSGWIVRKNEDFPRLTTSYVL
jgi:hypothetical protein